MVNHQRSIWLLFDIPECKKGGGVGSGFMNEYVTLETHCPWVYHSAHLSQRNTSNCVIQCLLLQLILGVGKEGCGMAFQVEMLFCKSFGFDTVHLIGMFGDAF